MTIQDIKRERADEVDVKSADLENAFTVFLDRRGNYVYNLNETMCFPDIDMIPDSSLEYYQCKELDQWTTVAYNVYGDTRYAWLLLKVNKIRDALVKPFTGQVIAYIPREKLNVIQKAMED